MEENEKSKLLRITLIYAVIALAVLFLANLTVLTDFVGLVFNALKPVVIGFVFAYLSNPIFNLFEKKCFYRIKNRLLHRILSLVLTAFIVLAILAFIISLIIPQLVESLELFYENYDGYLTNVLDSINRIIVESAKPMPSVPEDAVYQIDVADVVENSVFAKKYILSTVNEILPKGGLESVVDGLSESYRFILGLVAAFLMLANKEFLIESIKRVSVSLFGEKRNDGLSHIYNTVRRSFSGFFFGKIIDSTIIGFLTYGMTVLLRMPYAVLISTFVGITNVIPVVGPFIGAIPTSIIVLLAQPSQFLPYLLLILVIQQLDGNIIGPFILGNNTGVSALCVMIAVTVMGSIWGIVGMLIGVPIFATVIILTEESVEKRLQSRGMPISLANYYATGSETVSSLMMEQEFNHSLWRWQVRCEARLDDCNDDVSALPFFKRIDTKVYLFLKAKNIIKMPDAEYLAWYNSRASVKRAKRKTGGDGQ